MTEMSFCQAKKIADGQSALVFAHDKFESGFAPRRGTLRWRAERIAKGFFVASSVAMPKGSCWDIGRYFPFRELRNPRPLRANSSQPLSGSQPSRPRPIAGVNLFNQGLLQTSKSFHDLI